MSDHHPLAALLSTTQLTLPTPRQGAVAIKKLELALAPYPAYFRELQQTALEDLREHNPEAAEQIEQALESAQQAVEMHCRGLRLVIQILNDN